MKTVQRKRVTRKKPTAARAKQHDAKLLAKAEREAHEAVSVVDRLAAAIEEANARPSAAAKTETEEPAGLEALQVPMTFGQLCVLLGHDIEPERFASTALDSLAEQTETLADLVECAPDFSGDAWRLFKNMAERAKYASKVVSWLGSDKPAELPEVQS